MSVVRNWRDWRIFKVLDRADARFALRLDRTTKRLSPSRLAPLGRLLRNAAHVWNSIGGTTHSGIPPGSVPPPSPSSKAEARDLTEEILADLRSLPYDTLVGRYLDNPDHRDLVGPSGAAYHVQVEAFWDTGEPGDLRVMVTIDDGGRRALLPLPTDFIMAPDGTFVGE